jgi:thymidylate kinase
MRRASRNVVLKSQPPETTGRITVKQSPAPDGVGRIRRWFHPPGMSIVLCGADGSGKSTVGRMLVESLAGTFDTKLGRYYHWKPPLFSTGRRAARGPITDPHGIPPRNAFLSLLYFGFHWVEFFLGSYWAIRPVTARGGLVMIDRFFYDFFVDQRRYRLNVPLGVVRLGHWLLPQPDLVVLLDAPPDVLRRRKQEVPPEETTRQREAYRNLVKRLPNGFVADASQPPEKVVADIRNAVMGFLARRTSNRE